MQTFTMSSRATILLLLASACPTAFSKPEVERNVIYGMHSGLALLMDVYYPEKSNGRGIIFISGSGWTRDIGPDAQLLTNTGQEKIYAVPLAEAGFTVFNINHRAAPRFRYPDPVIDVQRAARFVRYHADQYKIDPDRIGAMGGSSGAHLVSMLGTMDGKGDPDDPSPVNRVSAKVQAVVTRAAPMDLRNDPGAPLFGYRGDVNRIGKEEQRLLAQASPITHVTKDDPPFLLIHGDADPVVPYDWSVRMHATLKKAGVKTELITVHGGGHGPRYEYNVVIDGRNIRRIPENAPDYIGAMIDWFNQHLFNN